MLKKLFTLQYKQYFFFLIYLLKFLFWEINVWIKIFWNNFQNLVLLGTNSDS